MADQNRSGREFSNKRNCPERSLFGINELIIFLKIICSGIFVGLIFDFYRIVRWRIGLSRMLTLIGDLFFSVMAVMVVFYFAQKANYLELRFYLFAGSFLGLMLYLRLISKYFKRILTAIIDIIANSFNTLVFAITTFFKSIIAIIAYIMSFPYGMLRWLGLLLFRMGEAVSKDTYTRVRTRTRRPPPES